MKDDTISDKLSPFYTPGEEEGAGREAVISLESEPPEESNDLTPVLPPKLPKPSFRQASPLIPENLENPFRNPQPTPIHWAVGWADLMMTMFIVFLVMYLYPSAKEAQSIKSVEAYQGGELRQSGSAGEPGAGSGEMTGPGRGGQGEQGQGEGQTGLTGGEQGPAELLRLGIGTTEGRSEPNVAFTEKLFDLTTISREDEEFARFADIDLSPDRTVRIALASDLLFPSAKADLRLIAKENIKKISELLHETPYKINVVGHTDDQPIRRGVFASNWELSVMRATAVARFLIEEMGVSASRITVSGQSFYQPLVSNSTPENRAKNRRVEIIVSLDPTPTLPMTKKSTILATPAER